MSKHFVLAAHPNAPFQSTLIPSERQHILDTEKTYYSIMLDSWEDNIVWDSADETMNEETEVSNLFVVAATIPDCLVT